MLADSLPLVRLGDVSSMGSGGTPKSSVPHYYGGGIPWVSIADITSCGKYINQTYKTLSEEGLKASAAKVYEPNVVLYAMYASLGECSISKERVTSSQAILGIKPGARLDTEFLYYFLQSIKSNVKAMGQQGTQSNLNAGMVKDFLIPLPTLAVQREIAKMLADTDLLISSTERLIAKKQSIMQGVIQKLLSGHSRLPGYSGEWDELRLGEISSGSRGAGLSKSSISADAHTPCLLYGELFTTYERIIESVKSHTNEVSGVKSTGGEVLIPGSTTTTAEDLATASALLQEGVLIGGDVNIISPDQNKADSAWLAYYLSSQRKRQIAELGQGTTIVHLYVRSLLGISIALPSISEQKAIVGVLQDSREEIRVLERRLQSTRQIKQGMMQELLQGRKRLTPTGE